MFTRFLIALGFITFVLLCGMAAITLIVIIACKIEDRNRKDNQPPYQSEDAEYWNDYYGE